MNWLSGLFKRTDSRMKAVIVLVGIAVLAGLSFLLHENKRNRESYLCMYEERQQAYTELLKNGLEQIVSAGADERAVRSWFSEKAEVSANSWAFCLRGESVLFAKDEQTTKTLREMEDKDVFLKQIENQDAFVTMAEGLDGYVAGVITAKSYALTQGQVQQHEIYLYLFWTVVMMVGVMSVIGLTAKFNGAERKLETVSSAMRRQNRKLEKNARQEEGEDEPVAEQDPGNLYDADLIHLFLKKSDDKALFPMQILFASIVMESRYYTRQEIFDALGGLKQFLGRTHVVGEMKKGCFIVLMYRTMPEEAQSVIDQYETWVRSNGGGEQTKLELSAHEVMEAHSALQIYEEYLQKEEVRDE